MELFITFSFLLLLNVTTIYELVYDDVVFIQSEWLSGRKFKACMHLYCSIVFLFLSKLRRHFFITPLATQNACSSRQYETWFKYLYILPFYVTIIDRLRRTRISYFCWTCYEHRITRTKWRKKCSWIWLPFFLIPFDNLFNHPRFRISRCI